MIQHRAKLAFAFAFAFERTRAALQSGVAEGRLDLQGASECNGIPRCYERGRSYSVKTKVLHIHAEVV